MNFCFSCNLKQMLCKTACNQAARIPASASIAAGAGQGGWRGRGAVSCARQGLGWKHTSDKMGFSQHWCPLSWKAPWGGGGCRKSTAKLPPPPTKINKVCGI